MDSKVECPACNAEVLPGVPACPKCGETLFVEHVGAVPRDGSAPKHEGFRDPTGDKSG